MMTTSLLGPTARPMVQLGGGVAWRQRFTKGVFSSYQWIDLTQWGFENNDDNKACPCMCLYRPSSLGKGAYVIPQNHAFRYGTREGNPTEHLFRSAFAAAEQIGFDMNDRAAVKTIIDIIIEGLPDLILMPSTPPQNQDIILQRIAHGIEATARINGHRVHEELL